MIEIVVYFFQLTLAASATFISVTLLRKNSAYLGNRLLSASLALVAVYALVLFLYKVMNSARLLQYSIRIGFIALVFAVFLLFCTIQVLVHSSRVIIMHKFRFLLFLIFGCAVSLLMVFSDWVRVENNDIMTLDYDPRVFLPFAGYIALMILYSMINLYWFGIRSAPKSTRKFLWLFFMGLGSMLCGLITEGIGGTFEGFAELFDILLFLFLSIGAFLMALSLLRKPENHRRESEEPLIEEERAK